MRPQLSDESACREQETALARRVTQTYRSTLQTWKLIDRRSRVPRQDQRLPSRENDEPRTFRREQTGAVRPSTEEDCCPETAAPQILRRTFPRHDAAGARRPQPTSLSPHAKSAG